MSVTRSGGARVRRRKPKVLARMGKNTARTTTSTWSTQNGVNGPRLVLANPGLWDRRRMQELQPELLVHRHQLVVGDQNQALTFSTLELESLSDHARQHRAAVTATLIAGGDHLGHGGCATGVG